jgi:hypothetical protein
LEEPWCITDIEYKIIIFQETEEQIWFFLHKRTLAVMTPSRIGK